MGKFLHPGISLGCMNSLAGKFFLSMRNPGGRQISSKKPWHSSYLIYKVSIWFISNVLNKELLSAMEEGNVGLFVGWPTDYMC